MRSTFHNVIYLRGCFTNLHGYFRVRKQIFEKASLLSNNYNFIGLVETYRRGRITERSTFDLE